MMLPLLDVGFWTLVVVDVLGRIERFSASFDWWYSDRIRLSA